MCAVHCTGTVGAFFHRSRADGGRDHRPDPGISYLFPVVVRRASSVLAVLPACYHRRMLRNRSCHMRENFLMSPRLLPTMEHCTWPIRYLSLVPLLVPEYVPVVNVPEYVPEYQYVAVMSNMK